MSQASRAQLDNSPGNSQTFQTANRRGVLKDRSRRWSGVTKKDVFLSLTLAANRKGILMKSIKIGVVSVTLWLSPALMAASEPDVDCQNAQSTPEINYCAELSYQAADKTLNTLYKQLSAELEPDHKKALVESQRAWVTFRDQHCAFDTFESLTGTGYSGYLNACLEDLTQQRSAYLRKSLEAY